MRRGQVTPEKRIDSSGWHGVSERFHRHIHFGWAISTTYVGRTGLDSDSVLSLLNSRVFESHLGRSVWKRCFELTARRSEPNWFGHRDGYGNLRRTPGQESARGQREQNRSTSGEQDHRQSLASFPFFLSRNWLSASIASAW